MLAGPLNTPRSFKTAQTYHCISKRKVCTNSSLAKIKCCYNSILSLLNISALSFITLLHANVFFNIHIHEMKLYTYSVLYEGSD